MIAAFMSLNDVARYNLVVVTACSYLTSFVRETAVWQTNWFAKLAAQTKEPPEDDAASNDLTSVVNSCEKKSCDVKLSDEFFASRAAIHRASIYWTLFLSGGVLAFGRAFVERWIGAEYLDVFPALALCVGATALYRGSSETNAQALQGVAFWPSARFCTASRTSFWASFLSCAGRRRSASRLEPFCRARRFVSFGFRTRRAGFSASGGGRTGASREGDGDRGVGGSVRDGFELR